MSVNKYNPTTGELERIAGGTLYADAPIGSIQAYGGTTAPSGWLLCQGQAVSRTEYAELFAAIGTAFGTGDGSTTFNVPDFRETVPVGIGENDTQTIAAHDSYTLGQFKDDQLQEHGHTFQQEGGNPPSGVPINSKIIFGGSQTSASYNTNAIQSTSVSDARTGTTTHGKQLGVNYIIKAKQVSVPFDVAEYIRKQNVLSDYEDITFSNNQYTALYDGILVTNIGADADTDQKIYINGFQVVQAFVGGSSSRESISLNIKKGDVISWSTSYSGTLMIGKVAYYKLRDYTGR